MVVLDTYAWVEYFEGSGEGGIVKQYVDSDKEILTPVVCLAEIKVKYDREKREVSEERVRFIISRSTVVNVDKKIALLSAENKLKHSLYLIDAIVYSTAQFLNAELLSGDKHFEKLKGVIFLK